MTRAEQMKAVAEDLVQVLYRGLDDGTLADVREVGNNFATIPETAALNEALDRELARRKAVREGDTL